MQIGEVIRKYRKERNMTQEEMANLLGVTAPAVNKWENGNTMPDILLLAPIARLLHISIDTLMSFQVELSAGEIDQIICEAEERLKREPYDVIFWWGKQLIEEYPSCEALIWQMAVFLDRRRPDMSPESGEYDAYIKDCYERVLDSEDEVMRNCAADSLYGFYIRKEQYEKAEECLNYFSVQNPERKRKQADIYAKTGRISEAYKAYEELLFSDYQMVSGVFHDLYLLAMQEDDLARVHMYVDKETKLARLFEMGEYHEIAPKLELAIAERDVEKINKIRKRMQMNLNYSAVFRESKLYEHMRFKEVREEFTAELWKNLNKRLNEEEILNLKNDNQN